MTVAQPNFHYQVGGSLDSNAPSYVTREADTTFYQALKAGQFCYVLNARQMGKSSLRVRAMQRLQAEGTVCIFIDLTGMGKQDVTPEKWYAGIVQSLVSRCQLSAKIDWRAWWRERRDLLSPVQRLNLFIEEVLLVEIPKNIVIFVDEIDRVLSHDFSLDDFFALIRYCYEQRDIQLCYQRLTFALLGVATPTDLIRNKTETPFNIGQAIPLQGFQSHEVQPLIEGLQGIISQPEVVIQSILDWTEGQPFLTQKLCQIVRRERDQFNNPQSEIEVTQGIEQIVKTTILENWEANDEPEHLRTIRDRILRNNRQVCRLLGIYQKICQQGKIRVDNNPEHRELCLSGLVVERRGIITVSNPIYAQIFDEKWIKETLLTLRPYANAIANWSATHRQDQSYLLRGHDLQDALNWALGKSLSDIDYQFLGASQDLAKQEAQTALEAIEKASYLLGTARKKARQEVGKRRIKSRWIPIIAVGVTLLILLLRWGGFWQGLELNLWDQFFCWRPLETVDKRIVLVTIDETDIQQLGQWPLSDQLLTQAIAHIKAQKPQAIGLDLYRDLPVEPGHKDLIQLFKSTPNLFGIEKVISPQIASPPILKQLQQVGFSDQVLDRDGKVRRALLSVLLSKDDLRYSLATKLALNYLGTKGITLKTIDADSQQLQLGKAQFKRFEGDEGGYVRAESGGYQILLNFRGEQANFLTFSLRQLLNHQIPDYAFFNRLVLIGTIAESVHDKFYTPFSGNGGSFPKMMSGLVVHANIISQIISAAEEGRPLLKVNPKPIENIWILLFAFLGAAMGWWFRTPVAIALTLLLFSSGLLGMGYYAFLQGWWLPIVPALLAGWGAVLVLLIVTARQREQFLLHHTLGALLEILPDYPTSGRIAIEYLKQSESQENQALIERRLAQSLGNPN